MSRIFYLTFSVATEPALPSEKPQAEGRQPKMRWFSKRGPRIFLPTTQATPYPYSSYSSSVSRLNPIASWLLGIPCYGEAIFAYLEPSEKVDFTVQDFFSLLATFTPLGIMHSPQNNCSVVDKDAGDVVRNFGLNDLFNLPKVFSPQYWETIHW